MLTGTERGWGRPPVMAALVAAVVLGAAFLMRQRRLGPDALVDLRLFRIPTFTGAITLSFTARLTSLGLFPFLILWLSGVVGHTPLQVGLTMMAISLPQAAVSSFSGPAARLASARVLCAIGTAVTGLGLMWAAAAVGAGSQAATAELVGQAGDAYATGLATVLLVAGAVAFASCFAALRLLPARDAAPPPATG